MGMTRMTMITMQIQHWLHELRDCLQKHRSAMTTSATTQNPNVPEPNPITRSLTTTSRTTDEVDDIGDYPSRLSQLHLYGF